MDNLKPNKTTIIFSHGFGIRKDNLGLFTYLSEKFQELGYETVLFDYYDYDETTKEIYTIPFSKQTKKLKFQIDQIKENDPSREIVIVAHSQGSIIPTLFEISGVSKVFGISPFFITDKEEVYKRYSAREEGITNFNGISKRKHSDGTTTVIPPEYWKERFDTDQCDLYDKLGLKTTLVLIYGTNDVLATSIKLNKIKNCKLIKTTANHDFTGENKEKLYKILLEEIKSKLTK